MRLKKDPIMAALMGAAGLLAFAYLSSRGRSREGLLLMLAGFAGAGALLYLPIQRAQEAREKRKEALARDYSQMVTLLSLYMSAGLTLRSSWEHLVRQYQEDRARGSGEKVVYEEMLITWRELKGGLYEDRAYGAFGRRCGLPEYLRLGGMLETYVQQGNRELLLLLEQEAAASLTQALQTVRKKGEQTGTRLLLPLLLLFAVTLLMVMVPAMLSMQASV